MFMYVGTCNSIAIDDIRTNFANTYNVSKTSTLDFVS